MSADVARYVLEETSYVAEGTGFDAEVTDCGPEVTFPPAAMAIPESRPRQVTEIAPRRGWGSLDLRELWSYREAHTALWGAPCDLDAAAAAVARYEDAVRARGEG